MLTDGEIMAPTLGHLDRVLGKIRGSEPGPSLIAVAGLHGNEPAGVLALQSVLKTLEGREAGVFGEFVALSGNRRALFEGRRYLSHDLNRAWAPHKLREIHQPTPTAGHEDLERRELQEAVDEVVCEARGPVFFLDLHTTSGPGKPFSTIMDSLASRRFALCIPVPLVVGLGELVEGTLLGHLADRGIPGVVFEGGQHADDSSVEASMAAIWLAMAGAGVIPESTTPEVGTGRRHLLGSTEGLPPVFELKHRHPVAPQDRFRMDPGFKSFQPIRAGQILARDRHGPVEAPETGRLLMPLYQDQGEDGFFVVREFNPFWLTVSEFLRRVEAGRFLPWLPGIRRDNGNPDRLHVDKKLARWFTVEVLHLLGYRRTKEEANTLVVSRQRESTEGP